MPFNNAYERASRREREALYVEPVAYLVVTVPTGEPLVTAPAAVMASASTNAGLVNTTITSVALPAARTAFQSTSTIGSPAVICRPSVTFMVKRVAIELHGVDADMHQHFQTRVGGDTDGVLGLSDCGHLAGHRCDDRV